MARLNTRKGAPYSPTSDASDRRDLGVPKNRKTASTGGGRAWSEDEEVYLLQTRLQKVPYKRIAAHLKKTELACRLHYHQLSHGGNGRRKRAASISSGSSSPVPSAIIEENLNQESSPLPRDITPPRSTGGYESEFPDSIKLPRIRSVNDVASPTILPGPASLSTTSPVLHLQSGRKSLSPSPSLLRLECVLPPPSTRVDMPRLQAVYAAHRTSFWSAITADYGAGVSPIVLEQAWKDSLFTGGGEGGGGQTPVTPLSSFNGRESLYDRTHMGGVLDGENSRGKEGMRRLGGRRCASA
ncbi:hypothetical protein GGR50DRAFT_343734 [Xylaria sp. CBS 124048]|nr:hypothetical protein GGR50DRAFT_343734 [Xylaria sp. CBS 124048]